MSLRRRGMILAVVTKNDEDDAVQPFREHPDMRLSLDDIAVFIASWEPKPEQLQVVADKLGLGLEALTFIDDSPVERERVRQLLPQVDVVALPSDPALYVRAVADQLSFEPVAFTAEDERRTEQYRARAEAARARDSAGSVAEFLLSLEMVATVEPIGEFSLPRAAQLIAKTNQFNVTTRRHSQVQVSRLAGDPANIAITLRLRDRFTDHGIVGVLIAVPEDDALCIDTWLLSCRVLGRTVEHAMLKTLMGLARDRGYRRLVGEYVRTGRNDSVRDLYARSGFKLAREVADTTRWTFDLEEDTFIYDDSIQVVMARSEGR